MNARLVQLGLVLTLTLAILVAAPTAGLALEDSLLNLALAPSIQGQVDSTPTPQGSRYSRYMQRKKALTPAPAATPVPIETPTPEAAAESPTAESPAAQTEPIASVSVQANALVDGQRLQSVIGDRLSSTLYGYDAEGNLLRSTDNGVTWALMVTVPEVAQFVMSSANPMVLYSGAGLDCGITSAGSQETTAEPLYRSSDGGVTWEQLALGDNLVPLLVNPQNEDSLLAADCEFPYLSANGGDSWQSKPDRSDDALWETYRMNEVVASSLVGVSSVDAANWNYLYASGTDEDGTGVVAYSGNSGTTWDRITPRISPQPRGISSIAADPTTAGRLWFTDRNGVWYTDDFGASWQLTILGLADVLNAGDKLDMTGLTDILYLPSDDIYLATIEGLYRGKPNSGIWTLVEDGEFGTQAIESLLMTESQPGTLWVNAEDGVYLYPVR